MTGSSLLRVNTHDVCFDTTPRVNPTALLSARSCWPPQCMACELPFTGA